MIVRFALFFLTLLLSLQSFASAASPDSSFISDVHFFIEDSAPSLSLDDAQARFQQGDFEPANKTFLTFGITNRPAWVRLALYNPTKTAQPRRLSAGQTWLDDVDVYFVENNQTQHFHSGDRLSADEHVLPEIGLVFNLNIPPGESTLWIKVSSYDPVVLPIELLSPYEAEYQDSIAHLFSGLLYGILLALAGFQLVLYSILKHRNALFYTIYISTFVIMNFGYSGYGFAWFYPNSPLTQNYSTIFFMVLHAVCGLIFMNHFLQLHRLFPKLSLTLKAYMVIGVTVMTGFVAAQSHFYAAIWSFGYITLTTIIMIVVCFVCTGRVQDAQYFMWAIFCSMVGLLITSLSVLGVLPYSKLGFHSAEIGVVCEAIILAVVVTNRLKAIEDERVTTKYLATFDPLTKLFNRHAFEESAAKLLNHANHHGEVMSLALLDLDHFKRVNDTYGHYVGDLALQHVADILKKKVGPQDMVARWGGEELVIVMPNTNLFEALTKVEAIRKAIEVSDFSHGEERILLTTSVGLASSSEFKKLTYLFRAADERLYLAKNLGRNRVEFVLPG